MLCVKHSVEWKEQTIYMHPSGLGVAVWCPWGFLSILSLLNPTSRGPFPILVKEYVSECLLCKVYGVPFELCERLERFQRASDLPAFLKRAESELRPNTWAFHMSSVISTTLQLPFTPSFGLLILASLSVPLSFSLLWSPPPPPTSFRAHTFSVKLRVSLSAVRIASSVITGASLLSRCSEYPCWIRCRAFLWFFKRDDWLGDSNPRHSRTMTFPKWFQDSAGQKASWNLFTTQPLNFWTFDKLC